MNSERNSFVLVRRWSSTCLALGLLAIAPVVGQTINPTVIAGEDWSFPFTPYQEPYSGIYQMRFDSAPGGSGSAALIKNIGRTLDWGMLNPAEDIYDFSYLESLLAQAKSANPAYGLVFRLKCSVMDIESETTSNWEEGQTYPGRVDGKKKRMVPEWVLEKYGITSGSTSDTFKVNSLKRYVAPWHPGVQREYLKFVREFARRGYLKSTQLLGLYVHGFSSSMGEELDLSNATYAGEAATTALAHGYVSLGEAIMACFSERLAEWKNAAGDDAFKLIWVGAGEVADAGAEYNRTELNNAALADGMGNRGGFIEHYYYGRVHPPKAGQTFSNNYMTVDWSSANKLSDGIRFWGDENEEDDIYNSASATVKPLMYRSSFFRAATTGMNFLWSATTPLDAAGGANGIPGWFTRVAGKRPHLSPDAVAWLRQAKVRGLVGGSFADADAVDYKNMERMLMQRDVSVAGANAMTIPASLLTTPYVQVKHNTDTNEYWARATQSTDPNISFRMDPLFKTSLKNQNKAVLIKVTYLNNGNTNWTVRVAQGLGFVTLRDVQNANDGAWKTATFTLEQSQVTASFVAGAGLKSDTEFDLHVNSGSNLTVRWVRVVRTEEVPELPVIAFQPESKTVLPSATATLRVVARGPNLAYQWRKNGSNVSGANKAYLERGHADHGTYSVVVTNAVGSVTSSSVTLSQAFNVLLDDFADGNESPWIGQASAGESVTLDAVGTDPSPAGNSSLEIQYSAGNDPGDWKYATLKSTTAAYGAAWSSNGVNALRFYIKGNYPTIEHGEIAFQLREGDSGERWNMAIGNFVQGNTWTQVTVPFDVLFEDLNSPAGNNAFNLTAIDQIRFYQKGTAARTIKVDKIEAIQL